MEQQLIEKLGELIAFLKQPKVPADKVLWDVAQCASYLCTSPRNFAEKIACKPHFPRAIRLSEIRGGLRWKAEEVMDWAESRREKRAA